MGGRDSRRVYLIWRYPCFFLNFCPYLIFILIRALIPRVCNVFSRLGMYESSCSYGSALDLKRVGSGPTIKTEECLSPSAAPTDWTTGCAYRFACNSTFQQLKQSVEKAKAALQDRNGYLSSAAPFGDFSASPFCTPSRTANHTQLDLLQEELRDDVLHEKRSHGRWIFVLIFTLFRGF